jgi:primosomal protein DnaI
VPKEIKEASMKNIDLDNPDRFKIIKWLKKFLDEYRTHAGMKGIYLTGNFGCGKTYLISAALNELANAALDLPFDEDNVVPIRGVG